MKWKTEKTENGTERVVRYFALVPTELSDGYTVWLQRYYSKEVWQEYRSDSYTNHWQAIETSVDHPDRPTTGLQTR